MDTCKQNMQRNMGSNMCDYNCSNMRNRKMSENLSNPVQRHMCERNSASENRSKMMRKKCQMSSDVDNYGCDCINDMPLAMAYVPWQEFNSVYDIDEALVRGTIFPELDLPFCGRSCD